MSAKPQLFFAMSHYKVDLMGIPIFHQNPLNFVVIRIRDHDCPNSSFQQTPNQTPFIHFSAVSVALIHPL